MVKSACLCGIFQPGAHQPGGGVSGLGLAAKFHNARCQGFGAHINRQSAQLAFLHFLQQALHQRIIGAVRLGQQALRGGKKQFLPRAAGQNCPHVHIAPQLAEAVPADVFYCPVRQREGVGAHAVVIHRHIRTSFFPFFHCTRAQEKKTGTHCFFCPKSENTRPGVDRPGPFRYSEDESPFSLLSYFPRGFPA